ncbi:MAG: hypothetical protein LJE62_09310 [Silicimonas sp.]|nr:hypothetical protein [Silicimonas sp.]
MTPKIATCCYCGTRAALVLSGKTRHELACSTCGAPLHELKMLRSDKAGNREPLRPTRPAVQVRERGSYRRKPPKKRTKSLSYRFMEEVWDAAEDIFDLFD